MVIRIETPEEYDAVGKILDALHFQYIDIDFEITKFTSWTSKEHLPFDVHLTLGSYREFSIDYYRHFQGRVEPAREFIKKPINYALLKSNRRG